MQWQKFIETRLKIVNKDGEIVPFLLNEIQRHWIGLDYRRKIELKARQQGFSSVILGKKTGKFLLMRNRYIVTIADNADNATGLLERVKFFLRSYEEDRETQVPLKYNSKYEIYNEALNNRWIIGTAENEEVGRSKTITDLHLSEAAFYKNLTKIFASALQAVVPEGEIDIETTANGFNEFKELWDDAKAELNGFEALFYPASGFYQKDFLAEKRRQLKHLYKQEYPETDIEAFLTSGELYFDSGALEGYLLQVQDPLSVPPIQTI